MSQAVTSGRLSKSILEKAKNSRRFEIYSACLEWEHGRDIDQVRGNVAPVGPVLNADFPAIAESRQAYEYYQAMNEQISALKEAGRLVDLEVAQREVFQAARLTRDRLLEIPEKMRFSLLSRGLGDADTDALIRELSESIYQTLLHVAEMDVSLLREEALPEAVQETAHGILGIADAP